MRTFVINPLVYICQKENLRQTTLRQTKTRFYARILCDDAVLSLSNTRTMPRSRSEPGNESVQNRAGRLF